MVSECPEQQGEAESRCTQECIESAEQIALRAESLNLILKVDDSTHGITERVRGLVRIEHSCLTAEAVTVVLRYCCLTRESCSK
jgi:hypothetical protein